MYVSILTGQVKAENWTALEQTYRSSIYTSPESLYQSFLLQDHEDPRRWQLVLVWRSRTDFERAERSQPIDQCVELFCDGGAVPDWKGYEAVRQHTRISVAG